MDVFTALSGPVVGAVIGYITNDLAIRMLFRPHRAVYVFGHRLPFTPGIVPRRKDQLAKVLGDAIVEKFFNADDLEIVFTDGISDAVADAVTQLLRSKNPPAGIAEALPPEAAENLERELCIRIQTVICTSDILDRIIDECGEVLLSRTGDGALKSFAESRAEQLSKTVGREIREFIIEHGYEIIFPLLRQELRELSQQPVKDITELAFLEDDELRETAKRLHLRFMSKYVRPIVESIDVGGMITEKIIQMSSAEVEDLVLSVVRRELRLVVLFGAFVGAVIGAVNIFI